MIIRVSCLPNQRRNTGDTVRKLMQICFGNKNTVMKPANNGAKNTADGPEYVAPMLGEDGLPSVGQKIGPGDPLWCAFVENCNEHIIGAHKDTENAYVDAIRFLGRLPSSFLGVLELTLRSQVQRKQERYYSTQS